MDREMIFGASAEERLAVADLIDSLDAASLATRSLCGEWSVRTVAAHLAFASKPAQGEFALRLAARFGSFDKANDDVAQAMAKRSTHEIVSRIRRNATSQFTPPGFGPRTPLTDVLIHSGDIRLPLSLPHNPDPERVRLALEFLSGRNTFGFAPRGTLKGIRLQPDDLDDGFGPRDGATVSGRGIDIAMVIAGRRSALDSLSGPGAALLAGRV